MTIRRRRLWLVDSELTPFGRHAGHTAAGCAADSAARLLARQPELAARVDVLVAGTARTATFEGIGSGIAQMVGEQIGLTTVGLDVHSFCASANTAVHQAARLLESGYADIALVVGLEHLTRGGGGPLVPEASQREGRYGFSPAVFYALCASRYMHETDAPVDALAQITVNNRRHGAGNANARFRQPVTLEDVLGSRMIAEPLTKLQCCPPADGGGALLLAGADVVPDPPSGAVEILGLGAASGDPAGGSLTSFPEDVASATAAYEEACLGPAEIDVAEVHDAFTISQVIHLEDVGLVARGEGWRHALEPEPRPVVNPSGGLLARGHPLGATGIAQFDSLRRYLTDDAIDPGHRRFGLVQEAGGLRPLGQMISETALLARLGA